MEKRKIDIAVILPEAIPRWKFWVRDRPGPSLVVAEGDKFFIQADLFASILVCENFSGAKPKLRVVLSPDIDNSFFLFLVSFLKEACGNSVEHKLTLIDSQRYETEQPLTLSDVVADKACNFTDGKEDNCRIMLEFSLHTGLGLLGKTAHKDSVPQKMVIANPMPEEAEEV